MAQATLDKILRELDSLKPPELETVGKAVQTRLNVDNLKDSRSVFHQAMLASGLANKIKLSNIPVRHALAKVQGQPVSETIIEERR
jgi:hypothetical protein